MNIKKPINLNIELYKENKNINILIEHADNSTGCIEKVNSIEDILNEFKYYLENYCNL